MRTIIKNIKTLAGICNKTRLQGSEMSELGAISNAWLCIEDDRILDFGKMEDINDYANCENIIDATDRIVLPSWCDSHTHIVYAGSRETEFIDKIKGMSYAEIAKRGGGILNSADKLHNTSEDELYLQASRRAWEMIAKGTGCIEIKSGYGLSTDDELKMLRVIQRMKETLPVRIVSTFLGAHAVARNMSQPEYIDLIINEMIPEVGDQ